MQKESIKHGLVIALACINRIRKAYSYRWDAIEVNYVVEAIENEIALEIEKLNI